MNKLRKIAFYLMIPIVVLCLLVSGVYFRSMGLTETESMLCALDNTVKLFLARPSIQPYMAFRSINENYTQFEVTLTHIYCVLAFLAPILMTTAIVAGFSAYIFDFINSIKISFKKKMFIIGDGKSSRIIASKYAKKFYVHYIMPSDTKNEERVPLLKKKVKAYNADYEHIGDSCKFDKMEKASYVVLNFKDWYRSFQTVTDVVEYLIEKNGGDPMPVYIVDAPGALHLAFESMYSGFCQKYGKGEECLKLSYINVNDANAHKFFETAALSEQPENRHHIVFIGMGGYGRAMLKELVGYMIKNKLCGTIELWDRSMESSINNLMYSAQSLNMTDRFCPAETEKNAKVSSDMLTDNGRIRMNYYQVSVGELRATNIMSEIVERELVTEVFCCLQNTAASFECFRMVEGYGEYLKDARIYFRVGPSMEKSFEAMQMSSSKLEFLPDRFPDIELVDEAEDSARGQAVYSKQLP